jgi:hypothetical protein
MKKTCCDKCIKLFGVMGCKGKSSCQCHQPKTICCEKCLITWKGELAMGTDCNNPNCQCHQGKEWLESRKNIHNLLKEILAGEKIKAGELPQIIVDAIDSAFIAGLEANPDVKLIQQNIADG